MLYVHIQKIKPNEKVGGTQKEKSEDEVFFLFFWMCFFRIGSKGPRFSVCPLFCQLASLQGTTAIMLIMTVMIAAGSGGECNYVHTHMDR